MILSRAPVRLTLGGGGTDLPSYYERFGGFLIAGAFDQYAYIAVNHSFYPRIRISYSKTEIVHDVNAIQHNIFREALKMTGLTKNIELVSIADVPDKTGLGSSGAFTVALLNALHTYKREYVPLKQLAEEACTIEIDILKQPIGKQDQYIAAFGGLTCFTFEKDGNVHVEPLRISAEGIERLENNIVIFYSGKERSASEVLQEQNQKLKEHDAVLTERLHTVKKIGLDTRAAFEKGNIDYFGEVLDEYWKLKKTFSKKVSDPFIDECYTEAKRAGALGGKIMGAGGGGFFLFYCPRDKARLIQRMAELGLAHMRFRFDFEGAKIIANIRKTSTHANIPTQPVLRLHRQNKPVFQKGSKRGEGNRHPVRLLEK